MKRLFISTHQDPYRKGFFFAMTFLIVFLILALSSFDGFSAALPVLILFVSFIFFGHMQFKNTMIRKITFTEDCLLLHMDGWKKAKYPFSQLKALRFPVDASGRFPTLQAIDPAYYMLIFETTYDHRTYYDKVFIHRTFLFEEFQEVISFLQTNVPDIQLDPVFLLSPENLELVVLDVSNNLPHPSYFSLNPLTNEEKQTLKKLEELHAAKTPEEKLVLQRKMIFHALEESKHSDFVSGKLLFLLYRFIRHYLITAILLVLAAPIILFILVLVISLFL